MGRTGCGRRGPKDDLRLGSLQKRKYPLIRIVIPKRIEQTLLYRLFVSPKLPTLNPDRICFISDNLLVSISIRFKNKLFELIISEFSITSSVTTFILSIPFNFNRE